MLILTVTGTPARGPGSYPRANEASTSSACSRTRSGRQSTIALIRGLTESSLCSAASATSRADTLRFLTSRATSFAERLQSSLIEFAPIERPSVTCSSLWGYVEGETAIRTDEGFPFAVRALGPPRDQLVEAPGTGATEHERGQGGEIQQVGLVAGGTESRPRRGHREQLDRAESVLQMDRDRGDDQNRRHRNADH